MKVNFQNVLDKIIKIQTDINLLSILLMFKPIEEIIRISKSILDNNVKHKNSNINKLNLINISCENKLKFVIKSYTKTVYNVEQLLQNHECEKSLKAYMQHPYLFNNLKPKTKIYAFCVLTTMFCLAYACLPFYHLSVKCYKEKDNEIT